MLTNSAANPSHLWVVPGFSVCLNQEQMQLDSPGLVFTPSVLCTPPFLALGSLEEAETELHGSYAIPSWVVHPCPGHRGGPGRKQFPSGSHGVTLTSEASQSSMVAPGSCLPPALWPNKHDISCV